MSTEDVKKIVLDIIADVAPDEELDGLNAADSLRDQLDLDSMDFLDIVMELKKRHQIDVPKEEYSKLESMDSCVEYLTPKFNQ